MYFSYNNLGAAGVAALGDALKTNTTLLELWLTCDDNISQAVVNEFKEAHDDPVQFDYVEALQVFFHHQLSL